MSLTIYGLRDSAGVEVFRGTIDPPPGGGSVPGIEAVLTENNDANGYDLLNVGQLTTNGSGIDTQSSDISTSGGAIGTGGGGIGTDGGAIDTGGGNIDMGSGDLVVNEITAAALLLDGAAFSRAAFVANGSTVDQLRDALIAAGLMDAS